VDRPRPDRRARRGGDAARAGCPTPACTSSRTPATGRSGRSPTSSCACTATSCSSARTRYERDHRPGRHVPLPVRHPAAARRPRAARRPVPRRRGPGPRGRALAPDAVVVIGPDHFHANFYDAMPPFVIGVEDAVGFGDFGSRPARCRSPASWPGPSVRRAHPRGLRPVAVLLADRRPRLVQSYEMVCGGTDIPMVPLVVNTAAPPLPTMERCVALGRALGDAIRAAAARGRVLVVASGGLSHWLPSNDPRDPSVAGTAGLGDPRPRGRPRLRRGPRAPGPGDGRRPARPGQRAWDRWFLKQLGTGTSSRSRPRRRGLEEQAGSGGHEIRTWLIGQAAVRHRWCGPATSRSRVDHRHGHRHDLRGAAGSGRRSTTPSPPWRSSTAASPAGTSPSSTRSPTTPPAGLFVLGTGG
jgi:2,3-dihydroxyphenylpropionate 1,2-dioxygenase